MKYKVKIGDTISKVARNFGIRPIDILMKNPHLNDVYDYIFPNHTLMIPYHKDAPQIKEHRYDCISEYGPTDVERDLDHLSHQYAHLIQRRSIGQSVMGKPIHLVKIGSGKKEIFYSGGWHANEWLTSKFLMTFINETVSCTDQKKKLYGYDVNQLFKEVTLFVVPMVNPDGIELVQQGIYPSHPFYEEVKKINKGASRFDHWSSNIRGVDLNHQWPAGWETEAKESPQQPWSRHFSGVAPLTEPEVQAVQHLSLRQQFAYVLSFHSQGQVIYWGYRNLEPKESSQMVRKLSLVSSYEPVRTADSDGGYKDWFIQETGRAGFTVEVGVGTNPLPFRAFAEIWSNNSLLALEGLTL